MKDDMPRTRTDYTPRLDHNELTRCRYCNLIFPNEIEAMTPNTHHGSQASPDCPLKKVYGKYINGEWVQF